MLKKLSFFFTKFDIYILFIDSCYLIALKFNFNNNGMLDSTPATRVIEDVISIKPKNVTDISSDKWRVYSKSEKTADELNARKQPQKKIEGVISETSHTVDASTMSIDELIDLMNDGSSEITGLSENESVGFDCKCSS